MKPIKALLAAIPALALAGASLLGASLLGAGAAAAAPGTTPNHLTGAANMVNTNARPGMYHAMSVNNSNGDRGMWCAVWITNGVVSPRDCK